MRGLLMVVSLFVFVLPVQAVERIELSQTACQFVEPEGEDKGYKMEFYEACQLHNKKTGEARVSKSESLVLKPGEYVFRVFNKDVPYVLGFWLRGVGLGKLTLPSVSGGGIETGGFKDYAIMLKAGEYVYSCPLIPTPDYKLIVKP